MRKIILFAFMLSFYYSCSNGECVECSKQLPNSTTTQEICQEGSDISVKTTLINISKDTLIANTSLASYQAALEAAGYTCK